MPFSKLGGLQKERFDKWGLSIQALECPPGNGVVVSSTQWKTHARIQEKGLDRRFGIWKLEAIDLYES